MYSEMGQVGARAQELADIGWNIKSSGMVSKPLQSDQNTLNA